MESVSREPWPKRRLCANCGGLIEAISTHHLCAYCDILENDPDREPWFHELRRQEELSRARERQLAALKVELGLPADAAWTSFTLRGTSHGPEWNGYNLEMHGINAGCDRWPPPWPFFKMGPWLTQVWLRRVTLDGCPAYVEARWHPERGESIRLIGLEQVTRQSDAERALRGLRLLRLVDKRGRKAGSRKWTRERFFPAVIAAYQACADQREYDTGDYSASQHAVAQHMGVPYRSFCRYLEVFEIPWPPL